MASTKISAFVEHVLTGLYRDRSDKRKLIFSIGRGELAEIAGGQRLGAAQKGELLDTCRRLNIGVAELPSQFLFFAPDDVLQVTADLNGLKQEIKKLTDHFAKIHGSQAAEEDWEKRKFPKAA